MVILKLTTISLGSHIIFLPEFLILMEGVPISPKNKFLLPKGLNENHLFAFLEDNFRVHLDFPSFLLPTKNI